jgi:hypothetical protein
MASDFSVALISNVMIPSMHKPAVIRS